MTEEEEVEAIRLERQLSQSSLDESSQRSPTLLPSDQLTSASRQPYFNSLHSSKMLQQMRQLRRDMVMCDVILEADGQEVVAHKVILASASPYFLAMFTNFDERAQHRVKMRGVSHVALESLVEYIYTCELHVTELNVQQLLPASNLLQLSDVRDACCEFLQAQLHPTNCLGIRSFADHHNCKDLRIASDSYIQTNFSKVVEGDEFLALPADRIKELISCDNLSVNSEEMVYDCVVRWIRHDAVVREHHLPELMAQVRLPLMSREFLMQHVHNDPMFRPNSLCKDYLIEALLYHLAKTGGAAGGAGAGDASTNHAIDNIRTKPRRPVGLPKTLLVIGGQGPKAIRSVEAYNFKHERWSQLTEMPTKRCRCGVAVLGGRVYVIGGFNGCLRVRTVDVYNVASDTWQPSVNMEVRRSTLGVTVLNNCIYAVGGFDGCTGLNTAEVFNPRTSEWRMIEPMSVRRSSVGVAAVNGILYAVGGYDGTSRQCLSSVEAYNPDTDRWSMQPSMMEARSGTGVGVLDGVLYAVGGHDGPTVRDSVEVFNPDTGTWRHVAPMTTNRRNAGVVTHNGLLFVVGGDDGMMTLRSVEMYNPKQDTWQLLEHEMSTMRSYAGVAVADFSSTTSQQQPQQQQQPPSLVPEEG